MTTSSNNFDINILSFYMPEQSDPQAKRYVFGYTVKIRNNTTFPAKLIDRHWIITNGEGKNQEVRGSGVIGEQPQILPGDSYEYTSGTILNTPIGTMHGYYNMINESGDGIAAEIKPFLLADPALIH